MQCPYCNAWTRVLASRAAKRLRECGNLHRFHTEEVLDKEFSKRGETPMDFRNRQMFEMWKRGMSLTAIAKSFGLKSHSEVSRVIKKLGGTGQRAHGQTARWAKRKESK